MISIPFFSQLKNKTETPPVGFVAYEEIDAKKTSKLGYFFLIMMVVLGIWQGNNFLNSLENVITTPPQNSRCLARMENNLTGYFGNNYSSSYSSYPNGSDYYYNGESIDEQCVYTKRETVQGIPAVYTSVYQHLVQKDGLEKSLDQISSQKTSIKNNRSQSVDEYSVSLLESIARKNEILNMGSLRETIKTSDDVIASLETTENSLRAKINEEKNIIAGLLEPHRSDFKKVDDGYVSEMNVYKLEQFALRLLFMVPMFLFVWRRYSRSKNSRSEFSLIWGGVVAIASILLAEVVLTFIYNVLPHELLQKVFAFLSNFTFFFVIAYWLGFILVPLFFGYLIYIIQKKYYNKKAVERRAFKANKCPTCDMAVAPHMVFCPTCGTTLKVKCSSCGGHTPKSGDFCELCGTRKVEPEVVKPAPVVA